MNVPCHLYLSGMGSEGSRKFLVLESPKPLSQAPLSAILLSPLSERGLRCFTSWKLLMSYKYYFNGCFIYCSTH